MKRLADNIILLSGWRRTLVAILAGAFAALGQAPFDFPFACFVSFPVLVWLLDGATPAADARLLDRLKPSFAVGWWFGFGYFLAGLWWVGNAVLVEGDTYAWALPFVVVGLPIILAFFFGFAAMLARLLWSDGVGRIFALAFAIGLTEWLRQFVLTGFPWIPIGFVAMPVPMLMQSVTLVGTVGVNALAVLVFAMPAVLAGQRHRRAGVVIALVIVAAHVGYGFVMLQPLPPPTATIAVRIVQPNTDLSQKWDASVRDAVFQTLTQLSQQLPGEGEVRPQVIVWPETSVPYLLSEKPEALSALGGMLDDGQLLLAGTVRTEGTGADALYYNSVVAINDKGEIADAVDKVHLVPFGEYLPFEELFRAIGIKQIVAGPMTYVAGSQRHAIGLPGGFSAIPYICYEIIFPALMPSAAPAGSMIVNVTNDAWFGDSPGPYQHLRQAQIRAVETGLPVVRSANTGISAAIDRQGRVVDAMGIGAVGVIDTSVDVSIIGRSVHTYAAYAGPLVVCGLLLVAFLMVLLLKLRRN